MTSMVLNPLINGENDSEAHSRLDYRVKWHDMNGDSVCLWGRRGESCVVLIWGWMQLETSRMLRPSYAEIPHPCDFTPPFQRAGISVRRRGNFQQKQGTEGNFC